MTYARTQPDHPRFDFAALKRERVAGQCVCCGSTRLASGEIWLLLVYPKSARDNIPGHLLKAVREEIENG